jgi:hypothetical protein
MQETEDGHQLSGCASHSRAGLGSAALQDAWGSFLLQQRGHFCNPGSTLSFSHLLRVLKVWFARRMGLGQRGHLKRPVDLVQTAENGVA